MSFSYKKRYFVYFGFTLNSLFFLIMCCTYLLIKSIGVDYLLFLFICCYLIGFIILGLSILAFYKTLIKKFPINNKTDSIQPTSDVYDNKSIESKLFSIIQYYQYFEEVSSLVLIEINDYIKIANNLSPLALDKLLEKVTTTLCNNARKGDLVFKWNKNKYVMVIRCDITNASIATKRYSESIKKIYWEKDTPVTISIKISQILKTDSKEDILKRIRETYSN